MRLSTSEEIPSTTVGRTASPNVSAVVASDAYDVTRMREEEFERLTVYIVPDVPCERGVPNRAERTLPRSLALRPSAVLSTPNTPTEGVWSTGVIPRGTRFGPFEGTRTPNKPNDKISWRYYWRIFKDSDYYYLDGSDTSVANWMRYVASAYSLPVMNLVACQHQEHIYFYTIRYPHFLSLDKKHFITYITTPLLFVTGIFISLSFTGTFYRMKNSWYGTAKTSQQGWATTSTQKELHILFAKKKLSKKHTVYHQLQSIRKLP
ncbi:unnamed protein product [Leptidea sinapis]|uniref:SET domain-containing protein n=1 Tax=Leptidea sinapis TaxID=189913 RepID=A0A5E4R1C1_9NEOP|nr:unnamed protein product [Leptidea sinapis]